MADATSVVFRGVVTQLNNDKIILVDVKNLAATNDTISTSTFASAGIEGVSALKSVFMFNATTGVQKDGTVASQSVTLTATNTGTLTAWLWVLNDKGISIGV